jgi:sugar lactone lactonase YvrE
MVETIGKRISRWGEGPVWYDDVLWYVDIEGHEICSLNPKTGEENSWEVGERVGFAIPRAKGGILMGGDNGLAFFDLDTGEKTPLIDPEPEKKPDNRFNDGKCDPQGRLWAGTISTVKKEGDATLYRLDTEKELTVQFPNVTNSNGLCWTKDGSAMFYIDTPSKKIRRFDFDGATGEISNESIAVDTVAWEGSPDGMTIDENDHLWVAFCRGSAVRCFDPESAELLDTIEIPVTGPTSCIFGGDDLSTLYITSGKFPNLEEEGAGAVYACTPGVRGRPSVPYAG